MLHESIVDQVDPGMRATVQVEGLATVGSRAMSPRSRRWRHSTGERTLSYFEGIVKLENVPADSGRA